MKNHVILTGVITAALLAFTLPTYATSFTISGASSTAQTLAAGQTGTVTSTGSLIMGGSTVEITVTGSSSITNSGTIKQTGTGRAIRDNTGALTLSVTNNAGALIQTADADAIQMAKANSNVTLNNYGSIISLNASAGGSQAIDWNAIATGSNTLNNYATGLIKTLAADSVRPGVNGVINNSGSIQAIPVVETTAGVTSASSSDGIDAQANNGILVVNSGSISGRHGVTGGDVLNNFTISVTNNIGGTITGLNGSGINIDGALTSPAVVSFATVLNYGSILGNYDSTKYNIGDGDGVDVDGRVNLTNYGIIRGIGAAGLGNNAEGVAMGGGTIINQAGAEITGANPTLTGAEGHGILVDDSSGGNAFAAATITNEGLIRGYGGYGIRMIGSYSDTITNNATGTVRGGGTGAAIQMGGGNDLLTNRGAIIGENGSAINLEDGDDSLVIEGGGASIIGDVSGGTGSNSLVLNPGSGNSFGYAGSFSNFSSVEVRSGNVALTGVSTYTGTTKLTGGTLLLDGANRLAANSLLDFHGGTLEISNGGLNAQTFASFLLSDSSVLDLNNTSSLTFNNFSGYTSGKSFSIWDYSDSFSPLYAIRFLGDFTLNSNFLAFIDNTTLNGYAARASFDGVYTDLGFQPVPEGAPTVVFGLVLIGMAGLRRWAFAQA